MAQDGPALEKKADVLCLVRIDEPQQFDAGLFAGKNKILAVVWFVFFIESIMKMKIERLLVG